VQLPLVQASFNTTGAISVAQPLASGFSQPNLLQPLHKPAQESEWDEGAFESAFEQAAKDLGSDTSPEWNAGQAQHVVSHEDSRGCGTSAAGAQKGVERDKTRHDSDALAQTAAQLLSSVGRSSSEKFQQSNFLALMRKLRDHEVVVEGDNLVEVRVNIHHAEY
jgi:hypothetical protein